MAKDKSKKNKDDTKPKGATPVDDDEFGGPGERSNFKLADHEGALLLITPRSLEEGIETAFGESDAIKADIVVLTNTDGKKLKEPIEEVGVLIFQRVVIGQLTESIGNRRVLGTIGRGVAKKGQSAPFLIEVPEDDDKAIARAYLANVDPFKA
jgi:hypothetical protein